MTGATTVVVVSAVVMRRAKISASVRVPIRPIEVSPEVPATAVSSWASTRGITVMRSAETQRSPIGPSTSARPPISELCDRFPTMPSPRARPRAPKERGVRSPQRIFFEELKLPFWPRAVVVGTSSGTAFHSVVERLSEELHFALHFYVVPHPDSAIFDPVLRPSALRRCGPVGNHR